MHAEESRLGGGPFVAPAASGQGRVFDVSDAPGPFELLVGHPAPPAVPDSRRQYANWSDADDLAKRRRPRDQTIAGQPLAVSSVLVYPPNGGGSNERVSLLQNFKIDGAALRADHRAYLTDTAGWMMRTGGRWRVFAEAHASRTGAPRHDDVLSEDRYLAVRAFLEVELAQLGSDAGRVRIAGQGVGFRHTLLPGEDPASRSVYLVVQADPAASPPPAWPPHGVPSNWSPAPTPVPAPPVGELNLDDFIEALQAAESANSADTPEQFLTRLRQLYYPGTDPDGLTAREIAFDRLLPDAPFLGSDGKRRILTPRGMDPRMFSRLAQHAPENPTPGNPLDNPSPYLLDASGSRVDIGHVVLTMDALAHPRAESPYTTFGVPAIDPASWVADLGSAAVWAERDGQPGAPRVLPRLADGQPDLNGYYRMSAPDADLLGDMDGFNIWNMWKGGIGGPLSAVFIAYYFDTSTVGAGRGGYRRRFRAFCTNTIGSLPQDAGQLAATNAVWRPRIDRFNDLFAAGALSAVFTLTPPPRRQWRFTPDVFARFLRWLEDGTRAESRRFP